MTCLVVLKTHRCCILAQLKTLIINQNRSTGEKVYFNDTDHHLRYLNIMLALNMRSMSIDTFGFDDVFFLNVTWWFQSIIHHIRNATIAFIKSIQIRSRYYSFTLPILT